jgi:hypothetical protein
MAAAHGKKSDESAFTKQYLAWLANSPLPNVKVLTWSSRRGLSLLEDVWRSVQVSRRSSPPLLPQHLSPAPRRV